MAKVVRLHRVGEPDVLSLDEVDVLEPGAGEVRIKVRAIGLKTKPRCSTSQQFGGLRQRIACERYAAVHGSWGIGALSSVGQEHIKTGEVK